MDKKQMEEAIYAAMQRDKRKQTKVAIIWVGVIIVVAVIVYICVQNGWVLRDKPL
jgi:predicted nucleic acid-binding Zn ribbon protein